MGPSIDPGYFQYTVNCCVKWFDNTAVKQTEVNQLILMLVTDLQCKQSNNSVKVDA